MGSLALIPLILVSAIGQAAPGPLPCAGPARPAQVQTRPCDLDEIIAANRTLEQVTAFWGEPRNDGPGGEMKVYFFPSRERLWLSFTEEGALTRAILLSDDIVPRSRAVMNELAITRARRRDQLDLTRRPSPAEVARAWGPPDSVVGSGVDHWVYTMADGEIVTLVFDGQRIARGDRMRFMSSYAYAVNDRFAERTGKPQPGDRGGGASFLADPRSRDPATGRFRIDIPALLEAIARDRQAIFLGTTPESTHSMPNDGYAVALMVDNQGAVQDYHWYRMNADGSWSGKAYVATNQDASGNLLLNPPAADADFGPVGTDRLNYSTFVGYFYVRPNATVGAEPRD